MLGFLPEKQRDAFYFLLGAVTLAVIFRMVPPSWYAIPGALLLVFLLDAASEYFRTAKDAVIESRRRFFRGGFALGFLTATVLSCLVQLILR